jgi:hypothetical protein
MLFTTFLSLLLGADANTDKAIGSSLLSSQTLLQMQRDNLLARWDQLQLSSTLLRRVRTTENEN